jgi:hypothetical protein
MALTWRFITFLPQKSTKIAKEAGLNLIEKLFFAGVNGVLGFEKAAPLLCAAFFQVFNAPVLFEFWFEAGGHPPKGMPRWARFVT